MGFWDILRVAAMSAATKALSGMSLEEAARTAPRQTGVYKLYLDGKLMKVGKAEWEGGIRWRMQQYWRGDHTAGISEPEISANRGRVRVVWSLVAVEGCRELEVQMIDLAGGISNLAWCHRR